MTESELKVLFKQHALDDEERFHAIDEKLNAILLKLNPMDATYVFTGTLWKAFLGFLGFISLLGGVVVAVPFIWHLLFPPKI